MDDLEFVIIVVLLLPVALLIMAIVALVKASNASNRLTSLQERLEEELADIKRRLANLESSGGRPKSSPLAANDEKTSEPAPEELAEEPSKDDSEDADGYREDDAPEDEDEPQDIPVSQPWLAARNAAGASPANTNDAGDGGIGLESRIGGRWSVLLGGLALALGVVFLVRHTIEAGLLGPGARIALGAAFSAALFAAGEWLRRSDRDFDLPVYAKADVPGILTGAGAIGAFATLFAAHALYGFIGPGPAFVGLTVIGIATMVLSTLHGPKLAAIGVLGAYVTPILVASNEPNPIALALHVLVVTASVLAIAHLRNWRWLAIAGFAASSGWTALAALPADTTGTAGLAGTLMVLGLALLFAALFWIREPEEEADHPVEPTAIAAFGLLFVGFVIQLGGNDALFATLCGSALAVIMTAIATYRTSVAPAAIIGVLTVLVTMIASNLPFPIREGLTQTFELESGLVPPDIAAFVRTALLIALPTSLLGLYGTKRNALSAPTGSGWLGSAVSAIAFFGILIVYLRVSPFETRPLIGGIALVIAALLAIATEYFARLRPEDMTLPSPAALATGAAATACLALSISLDKGWMPLAFALAATAIAAIYVRRPLFVMPWLSMIAGGIAGLTLWANMPFELPTVTGPVIANSLIILLAIPAAALIIAGELLRRTDPPGPYPTDAALTAGGLAIAGLFVSFEITHFINGGSLANVEQSLAEFAGYTLAAIGFAIGLQKIGERTGADIYQLGSQAAGILSVAIAVIGLLLVFNPTLDGKPVGEGAIFNLLLPAYLLTGIGAAAVALLSRPVRPRWYTLIYAALSGALLFTYFSLMLRKSFQGETLSLSRYTSDLEFWLYSALWLVLGAIVLAIGLRLKSLPIRIASGILISLTVVKVFLMDMASLTGVLRAFSFIGLGLSLIVIGRFYQRILTRQSAEARASASTQENDEE